VSVRGVHRRPAAAGALEGDCPEATNPAVDELAHLLQVYRARPTAPALWKLDVLMDLESLHDPRVLPFFLEVLVDVQEALEVRMRVVTHLRDAARVSEASGAVAEALSRVVGDRSGPELRLTAVLALTEFAEVDGVRSLLSSVARDTAEPLDLRYCAFTSLERAGPSSETLLVMRRLARDAFLGDAARTLLARWDSR